MCPNNTGDSRSAPPPAPPAAAAPPPYAPQPMLVSPMVPVVINKPNQWSSGLCGCCEDCSSSCVGAGVIYYLLAHACCCSINTCTYRKKLRSMYGLKEEPCADFFVHCFCHCCAICQEYRELQSQGFDPSVGWLANVDRLNRGGAMAPPSIATTMAL